MAIGSLRNIDIWVEAACLSAVVGGFAAGELVQGLDQRAELELFKEGRDPVRVEDV